MSRERSESSSRPLSLPHLPMQAQLRASLALADVLQGGSTVASAGGGTAGSPGCGSPSLAALVGNTDLRDQPNMASPERAPLPHFVCATPPEGSPYAAPGHASNGLQLQYAESAARRSLYVEGMGGGGSVPRRTRVSLAELADGGTAASRPPPRSPMRATSPVLHSGTKRGRREALGLSAQSSRRSGGGPSSPKQARRDLSRPPYRSEALHAVLSPPRPAPRPGSRTGVGSGHLRLSSAPCSPLNRALPVASPPRMNRAAEMRAAAVAAKQRQRTAANNAYLAHSPIKALREAAAAGLSLRHVARLASPGKTARPHHQRTRPETPAGRRLPTLAAGEEGAEPFSARQHSAEKAARSAGVPRAAAGAAAAALPPAAVAPAGPQPAATAPAAPAGDQASPPSVDMRQYESQRQASFGRTASGLLPPSASQLLAADGAPSSHLQAYLAMLHSLASGISVDPGAVRQATAPTLPPLPAELLEAAAAGGRRDGPAADGADTVRPLLPAAAADGGSLSALSYSPVQVERSHPNGLFAATPESPLESPLAQQRMVSITHVVRSLHSSAEGSTVAVATAEQQQQQQQNGHRRESISLSSMNAAVGEAQEQASVPSDRSLALEQGSSTGACPTVSKPAGSRGSVRVEALVKALAENPGGLTLEQLLQGGWTLEDVRALRALLNGADPTP